MLKMKDCRIKDLGNKFVRITTKEGNTRINTRVERIGRYIEDYKAGKPAKEDKSVVDTELESLKAKAKEMGISVHHASKKEKILTQIEEKELELAEEKRVAEEEATAEKARLLAEEEKKELNK